MPQLVIRRHSSRYRMSSALSWRSLDGKQRALWAPREASAYEALSPVKKMTFALLTQRWRTLQHITASPSKIGDIIRAALILTHFEHGYLT